MELFLKFPILIHLLNNKAKHIVMSFEEMPLNHYFKIVKTGIDPNETYEIECDYRFIEPEKEVNEPAQEDNESSVIDSPDGGTSSSSKDSSSPSL